MLLAGKGVGPQGRGPDPLLFAGAIEIRLELPLINMISSHENMLTISLFLVWYMLIYLFNKHSHCSLTLVHTLATCPITATEKIRQNKFRLFRRGSTYFLFFIFKCQVLM